MVKAGMTPVDYVKRAPVLLRKADGLKTRRITVDKQANRDGNWRQDQGQGLAGWGCKGDAFPGCFLIAPELAGQLSGPCTWFRMVPGVRLAQSRACLERIHKAAVVSVLA